MNECGNSGSPGSPGGTKLSINVDNDFYRTNW